MSKYVTKGGNVEEISSVGVNGGFVGHFVHSLDPKKRLTIPSEWRERLIGSPSLYVLPSLGGEKCLYVYPASEMAPRLQKLQKTGIGDKRARLFARALASRSDLVSFDSQGRIRIKDELLDYAALSSQVELVGLFNHFELWNPDRRKAVGAIDEATMEDALRYVDF